MRIGVIMALAFGTLARAAPNVTLNPGEVVLGRDARVEISVAAPLRRGRVRAVASVGELSRQDSPSPDEQRFLYVPPEIKHPQLAVLLFWLEEGGRPDVAVVNLPLIGRTDLQATTEPGAIVRVEVSKVIFGPAKADARGRVTVTIEVPPGTTSATVHARSRGLATSRALPLDVPNGSPLAAMLTPDPLEENGTGWLVVAHAGTTDAERVETSVEGGLAERESVESDRIYYLVRPARGASRLEAKVTLRGEPGASASASASVRSPQAPPAPPVLVAPLEPQLELGAAVGYFYAGGANSGFGGALGAGYPLPWASGRWVVEGAVGVRASSLSASTQLGRLDSAVLAVPVGVALRFRLLELGQGALYGRVGGGILPFRHSSSAPAGTSFTETAVGYEALGAVQGALPLGPVELFAELRGAHAPMRTAHLDANGGGLSLFAGVRHVWR